MGRTILRALHQVTPIVKGCHPKENDETHLQAPKVLRVIPSEHDHTNIGIHKEKDKQDDPDEKNRLHAVQKSLVCRKWASVIHRRVQ